MQRIRKRIYLLLVVFIWFLVPAIAWANTDIKITISDPSKVGKNPYQGTIVNTALSTPTVSFGENRALATLRITGKHGIAKPLQPGDKIMVALPIGLSYMQVPTAKNYKNYVQWPQSVEGEKNQIQDSKDKAGVKFVAGTPRSITVEVGNVVGEGETILDFVFSQENYSAVRVSRLVQVGQDYLQQPGAKVTRIDFLKMLADVTVPFGLSDQTKEAQQPLNKNFSDLPSLTAQEEYKMEQLVSNGIVSGFPGGLLKPHDTIKRLEAASLAGRVFPPSTQQANFKDNIPRWAANSINSAAAKGIIVGYPDGTFRPDQEISRAEAVAILQKILEYWSVKQ